MGDLDVVITHHGQKVQTEREALGDGRFRYTFVPGETGHYEVKATFNNDSIPGEEYLAVVLIVFSISCAQMTIQGEKYLALVVIVCSISCAQMTIPGEEYLALVLIVCNISCAQMTIPGEKYLALVLIVCCISCSQMTSI